MAEPEPSVPSVNPLAGYTAEQLAAIGITLVKRVKPPQRAIKQATETVNQLKAATTSALAAVKATDGQKAIRR